MGDFMSDLLTFRRGPGRRGPVHSRKISSGAGAWPRVRALLYGPLLYGLLLSLPGLGVATPEQLGTGISGRLAVAAPRVPSPASLLPSANSRREEEASTAKNQSPPNQVPGNQLATSGGLSSGLERLPGLVVSEEGDSPEKGGLAEVATRFSERVWSAGRGLLTPQSLLTAVRAAQSGTLSQHGKQTAQQLQDQLLHAVLDQGIDELRRGVEGDLLRNLELRYQTPLNGRSGMFSAEAVFSLLDQERWAIFAQAGGLLGNADGGFNLGLGYRRLLANEWLLLGTNLFFDHNADSDLRRISVGAEAKSTSLDLYLNWYHMIGAKNQLGAGVFAYTPEGFDVELVGRLPAFPWVELSGRYYQWFLEAGDVDAGGDDKLYGLRYQLNLQPVPLFGVEFSLEDPERGKREWALSANLKYRFGVPLLEQLRVQRVKAHDPIHRRFERVRREYRVLTRKTRPSAVAASPLRFMETNFRISLVPGTSATSRRITLRAASAVPAGTTFQLRFEGSGANPAVFGTDYDLSFPPNAGWGQVVSGSSSALSPRVTSHMVTYTAPENLDSDDDVYFEVRRLEDRELTSDREFTIQLSGSGIQEISSQVTLTYQPQIGFADVAPQEVEEGGPAVSLMLTGGPATDAAPDVQLMAPAECRGRLTLNQSGADIPLDAVNNQWPISLSADGTATFTVLASEDDGNTVSETCVLQVVAPQVEAPAVAPYTVASDADRVTLTLVDNDELQVRFAMDGDSVQDGEPANVGLTLSGGLQRAAAQTVTVNVQVSGSATASDYTLSLMGGLPGEAVSSVSSNGALTLTLILPAGDANVDKTLVVATDEVATPGNKTLGLTLNAGTGYVVRQPSTYTLTLVDNENLPQLSLRLVQAGSSGCAAGTDAADLREEDNSSPPAPESAMLRLCASVAFGEDRTVTLALDDSGTGGTGTLADLDGGGAITLTLAAGQTSTDRTLTAAADGARDSSARENLVLTLPAAPTSYQVDNAANAVTLTIVDAQIPRIGFAAATPQEVVEEDSDGVDLSLTGGPLYDATTDRVLLALVPDAPAECQGRLTLNGDPANDDAQWQITFGANAATATFTVAASADDNTESESCVLQVVASEDTPYTAASDADRVTLTLVDNDALQVRFVTDSGDPVLDGSSVNVGLTLSGPQGATAQTVTVNVQASGSATTSDYTLSLMGGLPGEAVSSVSSNGALTLTLILPAGDTSVNKTLVVATDEVATPGNKTLGLTLNAGTGYVVRQPSAYTLTLVDNENLPELSLRLVQSGSSSGCAADTYAAVLREEDNASPPAPESAMLILCASSAFGEDLTVTLDLDSSGTGTLADLDGGGAITLTLPAGQTSTDRTLTAAADGARDSSLREDLVLALPAAPTSYQVASAPANAVTLTIVDAQAPRIGFAAATSQEREIDEGGAAKSLSLTGGPLYDATTDRVLLTAVGADDAATTECLGLLTLNGDAVNDDDQWQITFGANAATATFTVAAIEDNDDTVSESCVLQVVASEDTPYTAASDADRITLMLLDNDALQIRFATEDGDPVGNGESANVGLTLSGGPQRAADQTLTVNVQVDSTSTAITSEYTLSLMNPVAGESVSSVSASGALTLTLILPVGDASVDKTLVVAAGEVDGTKTLVLTLVEGTGYVVSQSQPSTHTLVLGNLPQLSLALDPTGDSGCADGTNAADLREEDDSTPPAPESAMLRLCASSAFSEERTVNLEATGTASADDLRDGISITLTLAAGQTSIDQTLTAAADGARDSSLREDLVLTLPDAPVIGGIPRYQVDSDANAVTLTIVDAQIPQIGFVAVTPQPQEVMEGGSALELMLTGGPLYDAANDRVLVTAVGPNDQQTRHCLSNLLLGDARTATTAPYWSIPFGENMLTAIVSIEAQEDNGNFLSESCTLRVIESIATPAPYTVASNNEVDLTLLDNDVVQVEFEAPTSSIAQEGGSSSIGKLKISTSPARVDPRTVTVNVRASGTATSSDYTLRFRNTDINDDDDDGVLRLQTRLPPGKTSATYDLVVSARADNGNVEGYKTLVLTLEDGLGYEIVLNEHNPRTVHLLDDDDAAALSLVLYRPGESDCTSNSPSRSAVLRENSDPRDSAVLRLCASRAIVGEDLTVTLSPSGVGSLADLDGGGDITMTLPVGQGYIDRTVTVAADGVIDSRASEDLVLTLPPAPTTVGGATVPPRYLVAGEPADAVTLTIMDASTHTTQIGFADTAAMEIGEGGSADLTLSGGPVADAANNPILLALADGADAGCGRLTLDGGARNAAGQWSITFDNDTDETKEFTVAVTQDDDNEVSEICPLVVVASTSTPAPYTVATDRSTVPLTLFDDDGVQVGFTTASSSVRAGQSVNITAVIRVAATARSSEEVRINILHVTAIAGNGEGQVMVENSSSVDIENGSRANFANTSNLPADAIRHPLAMTFTADADSGGETLTLRVSGTLLGGSDRVLNSLATHQITITTGDIGFEDTAAQTVAEGSSISLTLSGGPVTDAANNPVLLTAPEACQSRLTLNGEAVNGAGQWRIPFGGPFGRSATRVAFTVAVSQDNNDASETCTLEVVAPGGTPAPYTVAANRNTATLTIIEPTPIGFADGTVAMEITEGSSAPLTLTGGPVADAANNPVLLELADGADAECQNHLILDGNAMNAAGQWPITFDNAAKTKEFTVAVTDDANQVSEVCTLVVVASTSTPAPYTVAADRSTVPLTLLDDEGIQIGFATASSSVKAGESVDITIVVRTVDSRGSSTNITELVVNGIAGDGAGSATTLENSEAKRLANDGVSATFSPVPDNQFRVLASRETEGSFTMTFMADADSGGKTLTIEISSGRVSILFSTGVALSPLPSATHQITITAGGPLPQIGFGDTTAIEVTEGGDALDLTLTGGPVADAANNPVLLALASDAPAACQSRLTLDGNAVNSDGQWPIYFVAGAASKTFPVVVSQDDNDVSELCTLEVVASTSTPAPYTVAPDANTVALTLFDDDGIQIGFATASSSVAVGASGSITLIIRVATASSSATSISYSLSIVGNGDGFGTLVLGGQSGTFESSGGVVLLGTSLGNPLILPAEAREREITLSFTPADDAGGKSLTLSIAEEGGNSQVGVSSLPLLSTHQITITN